MITVKDLYFEYPGVLALDNVSFSVGEGSITALVGPNGAGKTTLLRCIAALDEPVSGGITLDGVDVLENPRDCHRKVGYISDFFGLYDNLTVEQCLRYTAMSHGMNESGWEAGVKRSSSRVGLGVRLQQKAGALSRGLRQRLAIAQSIIHSPKLLLLDEPASGLDPEARAALSGLFKGLRDEGMTLVVSSHIIAELEEYSTDMLILKDGRVAGQRRVGQEAGAVSSVLMKVTLARPDSRLVEIIGGASGVSDIRLDGRHCWFRLTGGDAAASDLLGTLVGQGVRVSGFTDVKAGMQHEYMTVVRPGAVRSADQKTAPADNVHDAGEEARP
ncbi:MAG: ABC transporter ATP-binding protein [Nitrospirae bacterium]|nr:ABC transporter ATP-binding protein [Nitrospirota bacterium]